MATNFPVKQHYIPQMLLNHFCDPTGALYVFDKDNSVGRWTSPRDAFFVKHLYTTFEVKEEANDDDASGRVIKSKKYEDALMELERKTARIIEEIIQQCRTGRILRNPSFHEETLRRFIITLARRTPESQARVRSGGEFKDVYYEAAKRIADAEGFPLPDKEELFKDPDVLALVKLVESSITGKFAVGEHPHERQEEERFLLETGLCFAVSRLPGEEFIIGSHGIAILPPRFPGDPLQGSWVPIAYDVAVKVTGTPGEMGLLELDKPALDVHRIRAINRGSAKLSKVIAGRHEPLVRLLADG